MKGSTREKKMPIYPLEDLYLVDEILQREIK